MKTCKLVVSASVVVLASLVGNAMALEPIGANFPTAIKQLDRSAYAPVQIASSDCLPLTKIQHTWTRKEAEMEPNAQAGPLTNSCRRVAVIDHHGAVIRGGMLE